SLEHAAKPKETITAPNAQDFMITPPKDPSTRHLGSRRPPNGRRPPSSPFTGSQLDEGCLPGSTSGQSSFQEADCVREAATTNAQLGFLHSNSPGCNPSARDS